MSTKVETVPAPPSYPPPNYEAAAAEGIELGQLRATASADSLPQYDTVEQAASSSAAPSSATPSSDFHATKSLQIESRGRGCFGLPFALESRPTYIHTVTPTGEIDQAVLVSIRPKANSGTCFLAHADDAAQTPLCTTTYRFGPMNPPKIKLLNNPSVSIDDATEGGEDITLDCKSSFSRATVMRTPYGSFEWRYSTRAERRAVGPEVDSLLILDRKTTVALAGGKKETRRCRVGQFVRGGGGLRTEGTKRSTAGNGGRLMLDLNQWVDGKGEVEQVELLAVASCVSMLKKEVDRRRFQQSMLILGAGS